MAKSVRPQGIAVCSEQHATQLARKNARWTRIPPAFRVRQGDEDPHDLLNELSEREKHDPEAFRQGLVQKCFFSEAVVLEEEQEAELLQQGEEKEKRKLLTAEQKARKRKRYKANKKARGAR